MPTIAIASEELVVTTSVVPVGLELLASLLQAAPFSGSLVPKVVVTTSVVSVGLELLASLLQVAPFSGSLVPKVVVTTSGGQWRTIK